VNGHARGIVYICTYVRTQYDEKRREKRLCTILPPNGGLDIVQGSGQLRDKKTITNKNLPVSLVFPHFLCDLVAPIWETKSTNTQMYK
jgi:hypothetical protein